MKNRTIIGIVCILMALIIAFVKAEILAWDMKIISQDLLDDGMLLWNKDDAFWMNLLTCNFREVRMEDVYHAEYDKHERLFLCVK